MFNPSREQVRTLFFEAWRKYCGGEPLAGVEALALEAILLHPEYHRILEAPERYRDREYFPELGETNPFLHLSLHVALEEQLAIDQPAGVRERFARIALKAADRHAALHAAIDCVAEMVWRAQKVGTAPDAAAYLDCLEKSA
jgi:hypothetical protein